MDKRILIRSAVYGLILGLVIVIIVALVMLWNAINAPRYDEQSYTSFGGNFTQLAYNITAIEQNSSGGYGLSYLLNGVSNEGYWYQVGLGWNWPTGDGGINQGFRMIYEIMGPTGASVYPSTAQYGSGAMIFSKPVKNGDKVLLRLYFLQGNVIMSAYDWNTSAYGQQNYSSFNASDFVGFASNISRNGTNRNFDFTGLMTEQASKSILGYNGRQIYILANNSEVPTYGLMVIKEGGQGKPAFFNRTNILNYTDNTDKIYSLNINGSIEQSNATEVVTGHS